MHEPSWHDGPAPKPRTAPLRFLWQTDPEGRFTPDQAFSHLIGPHTAAGLSRSWREVADAYGLDSDGRVARALATRQAWTGITLHCPVDGGDGLDVELTGLPALDRSGQFGGYRGFGICRDLEAEIFAWLRQVREGTIPRLGEKDFELRPHAFEPRRDTTAVQIVPRTVDEKSAGCIEPLHLAKVEDRLRRALGGRDQRVDALLKPARGIDCPASGEAEVQGIVTPGA